MKFVFQALEQNQGNTKALFRRAQAWQGMKEYNKALVSSTARRSFRSAEEGTLLMQSHLLPYRNISVNKPLTLMIEVISLSPVRNYSGNNGSRNLIIHVPNLKYFTLFFVDLGVK